ncbi:hypothetical protein CIG75_03800 [Tumebacillus algifaecis]|uniref:Uncharacterized protein n=1 Tax=Tumebacillus algifaecis TaxID=1214604 RepID=A0A223CYF0_9BACL|nr:hypothetical protein [Tumebacillus algifaecis]ASS74194.1 hypothetical protein CIG75_03800 [Tumebacillus algifaecis]
MRNYIGWIWSSLSRRRWKRYTSQSFKLAFEYPPNWIRIEEERYQGRDGFFQIAAASGEDGLDAVCQREAHHKFKPYGTNPKLKPVRHAGRAACYVFPSVDQPTEMKTQSAFIVEYPAPVQIAGQTCRFLVLWADEEHIRNIVKTLTFK